MRADLTPSGQPTPREAGSNTSLKWGQNGELSPVDLQRVLERLTDPALTQCSLQQDTPGD
jgi:hypothetical protein